MVVPPFVMFEIIARPSEKNPKKSIDDYYNFYDSVMFAIKYDVMNTDYGHCKKKYTDNTERNAKCENDVIPAFDNLSKYHISKTNFFHCDRKYNGIDYDGCLGDFMETIKHLNFCECDNIHLTELELPYDSVTLEPIDLKYTDLNHCHKSGYPSKFYDRCLGSFRNKLRTIVGYNIMNTDLNYCDDNFYGDLRYSDSSRDYDEFYQKCIMDLRRTIDILPKNNCRCYIDNNLKKNKNYEDMIDFYSKLGQHWKSDIEYDLLF